MNCRPLLLSLAILSVLLVDDAVLDAKQAHAEARVVIKQPRTDRQIELNIHGTATYGFGWYDGLYRHGHWGNYAVGPGIQLLFPIVKNAIPSLNNPIYLGFFADLMFIPHFFDGFSAYLFGPAFGPLVQWRFNILDILDGGSLSAFVNVGFGLWPWITRGYYCDCTPFYFFPVFELGANVMFTRHVGLTLSFGYPSVKFGLNIAF
jgi:hypothetical protein